jgi:hypothetical protein
MRTKRRCFDVAVLCPTGALTYEQMPEEWIDLSPMERFGCDRRLR